MAYFTLIIAKGNHSGDEAARELLRLQDPKLPLVGALVPRTETAVYEKALDGARRNCQAAETFEIISFARGDDAEWSVEGMDAYDVADAAAVIENALAAQPLEIPSPTYQAEIKTRAALAQMRDAKEEIKQKVREEIQRGTTAESVMPMGAPRLSNEEQQPNEQRRIGSQRLDQAGASEPGIQPEPM
jgi:hypothetical protein